jgi:hypothetical protein
LCNTKHDLNLCKQMIDKWISLVLHSSRLQLNNVQVAIDCERDMCVEKFEQCGGNNMTTTSCCDGRCVVKNFFYAQCLTTERVPNNVEEQAWDGRVLACGEDVPLDAPKGPEDPAMVAAAPSRRLSEVRSLCLQAHVLCSGMRQTSCLLTCHLESTGISPTPYFHASIVVWSCFAVQWQMASTLCNIKHDLNLCKQMR